MKGRAATFDEIRATARRLGRFSATQLAVEAKCSLPRAQEVIGMLIMEFDAVRFAGEERGPKGGRPARVFEYVKPTPSPIPARPKAAPPELVLAGVGSERAGRGGQTTNGRGRRTGSPVVNELLREVRPQGVQTRETAHKIEYLVGGQVVASSSKTPGASSLKQTRSQLRKAGIAA